MFSGNNNTTIAGNATVTNIGGDQHVYHQNMQVYETERGGRDDNGEFQYIRSCEISLLGAHIFNETINRRRRNLRISKDFYTTEISGRPSEKCTTVIYTGDNALEEWEDDFRTYSQLSMVRPNTFQLFGYNRTIPALMFHHELIPISNHPHLSRFGEGLFWTKLYLSHVTGKLKSTSGLRVGPSQLWINTKRNCLVLQTASTLDNDYNYDTNDEVLDVQPDIEFLNNDVSQRFLSRSEIDWDILIQAFSLRLVYFKKEDDISHPILDTDPYRTIPVYRDGESSPIFTYTSEIDHPDLLRWSSEYVYGDAGTLVDGDIQRFLVTKHSPYIWLATQYTPVLYAVYAWLAQAHSLLGDDAPNAESYYTGASQDIRIWLESDDPVEFPLPFSSTNNPHQLYLFVKHVPFKLVGPSGALEAWLEDDAFFWSFDESGQAPIPRDQWSEIGIPELRYKVRRYREYSWPSYVYDAIRDYQIARGFDPNSTEFAQHLGLPVFQRFEETGRFQELTQSKKRNLWKKLKQEARRLFARRGKALNKETERMS